MAPTDPTTTSRLKVFYAGPYGAHSMLFHGALDGTQADLIGWASAAIEQFVPLCYDGTTFNRAEFADAGVNFFTEVDEWVTQTADTAFSTSPTEVPSKFLNFCGRSPSTGKRTKLYLYETPYAGNNAMRVYASAGAPWSTVLDALNGVDINLCAIDGTPVTWKNYVNLGQNDYLTHRARRT